MSWKTYSHHRQLYFNVSTNHWILDAEISRSTDHDDGHVSRQDVLDASESPPLSPSDTLTFMPIESQASDTSKGPPNEVKRSWTFKGCLLAYYVYVIYGIISEGQGSQVHAYIGIVDIHVPLSDGAR